MQDVHLVDERRHGVDAMVDALRLLAADLEAVAGCRAPLLREHGLHALAEDLEGLAARTTAAAQELGAATQPVS